MPTLAGLLADRVARAGSRPLLTWYDLASGARTEFSATSFANWVDKTANLLDTLGVESGWIAGELALDHPGHWVSLVWPVAAWQAGCGWAVRPAAADDVLAVVGPEHPRPVLPGATIACSLHPLALPLPTVPDGVIDYTGEVLAEPDVHLERPAALGTPLWTDAGRELAEAGALALSPQPGRVLVRPVSAWQVFAEAIVRPLLGGGSAVVVVGTDGAEAPARIAATERTDAVAGWQA
ncbi:MAG TPA: TIGR03089 family protein [Propionicimonas sp.]|nr:TIGR03089 family protein [Propionicimonas sp.]